MPIFVRYRINMQTVHNTSSKHTRVALRGRQSGANQVCECMLGCCVVCVYSELHSGGLPAMPYVVLCFMHEHNLSGLPAWKSIGGA